MKSVIVCFSQTGNTWKLAEAIKEAISAQVEQCDLVRLREASVPGLAGYDLIGLGCPTFAHREPVNVGQFIRGMGPLRGKQVFIFATHGGHPSNTLTSMAAKLRRQGLSVIGGFNCDGSDHMPHFTTPWFTEGHPDEIDLRQAADFGREMVEHSRKIARGAKVPRPRFEWIRGNLPAYLKTIVVNKALSRGFDIDMVLNRQKCRYPKCRLCAEHCPVNAIDLSAAPMVFRKGCISCYFCELICPTGAIEVDPASLERQREARIASMYSRGYPEFFERARTELIGNRSTLFRPLVDVKIGNVRGMHGEPYSLRRPRYVIRDR